MKARSGECQPELLMRYMDQELDHAERALVIDHLKQCSHCQLVLQQSETVHDLFKKSVDEKVEKAPLHRLEELILGGVQQKALGGKRKRSGVWLKRTLVPVAGLAAATVLFFALYRPFYRSAEPSAIINSFTAEGASVMILETPETRQTILWFQEMPGQGGEDDRMQQV